MVMTVGRTNQATGTGEIYTSDLADTGSNSFLCTSLDVRRDSIPSPSFLSIAINVFAVLLTGIAGA